MFRRIREPRLLQRRRSFATLAQISTVLTYGQQQSTGKVSTLTPPPAEDINAVCRYFGASQLDGVKTLQEIVEQSNRLKSLTPKAIEKNATVMAGEKGSIDVVVGELPVALVDFSSEGNNATIFVTPSHSVELRNWTQPLDWFDQITELARLCGSRACILVPHRKENTEYAVKLAKILADSGFQCSAGVSFLEVVECLLSKSDKLLKFRQATTLHEGLSVLYDNDIPASPSFASSTVWQFLSLAVREAYLTGVPEIVSGKSKMVTPAEAVNCLCHPFGNVFTIGMTALGMATRNFSFYNVASGKKDSAHGSVETVIQKFLELSSNGPVIIIPNPSADSSLLMQVRGQLKRLGRTVHLVWPSNFDPRLSGGRIGDPEKLAQHICSAQKWHAADLILEAKKVAGEHIRNRILRNDTDFLAMAAVSAQPIDVEQGDGSVVHPTAVQKYLDSIYTPERSAYETDAQRDMMKFIVFSPFCTDSTAFGRQGNPHVEENFVYSLGMIDYNGHQVLPEQIAPRRGECRLPVLDEYDVVVTHNAKEFLLLMWEDPELQKFIARGGRLWCTLLAEYLLSGQRTTALEGSDLYRIATSVYGVPIMNENDRRDVPWGQRVLSELREESAKDLLATTGIYCGQLERAVQQVQLISVKNRMLALYAFSAIERAGIFVNENVGKAIAQRQLDAVTEAQQLLSMHIPKQVPLDLWPQFDWNSQAHLEAFFYGGTLEFGRTAEMQMEADAALVELSFQSGTLTQLQKHKALPRYLLSRGLFADATAMSKLTPAQLVECCASYIQNEAEPCSHRLIIFDIESTGLDSRHDRIVEISCFDPHEGKWFSSLVNPERPMPSEVVAIHGITDDDVKNAPCFKDIADELLKFLRLGPYQRKGERVILAGHYVWGVDEPFLRREFLRALNLNLACVFCDTMPIFRSKLPIESFRLTEIAKSLGLEQEADAHRAEADVMMLYNALTKTMECAKAPKAKQRLELLKGIAVASQSSDSCLTPKDSDGEGCALLVHLPGEIQQLFPSNWKKVLEKLQPRQFDTIALKALIARGSEVARILLQQRSASDASNKVLHLDNNGSLFYRHLDGCVRQEINVAQTATTRTTSSNPSAQNIPKDDKSELRKAFTSRFGDSGMMVEIDYSALEIAVQAMLSEDDELLAGLRQGIDYHLMRASWLDPSRSYEEMVKLKAEDDRDVIALRRKAKVISFQRLYGAGPHLLAKHANLPLDTVRQMIEGEQKKYPGIARYQHLVRLTTLRKGNPGLPTHYIFELPTGLRMSFEGRVATLGLPPLKNYPIQGYAAELVQAMVGRVFAHYASNAFYGGKVAMINFVHDSLWLDCHKDVVHDVVRDTEKILSGTKSFFDQAYPNVKLPLDLGVHTDIGHTMYHMVSYKRYKENPNCINEAMADDSQLEEGGNSLPEEEDVPGLNPLDEDIEATPPQPGDDDGQEEVDMDDACPMTAETHEGQAKKTPKKSTKGKQPRIVIGCLTKPKASKRTTTSISKKAKKK